MNPQLAEEPGEAPHPRATQLLVGHAGGEAALLSAYRSLRVPHAFLLSGPKGIGKATLAYRMARFVLAHPDPASPEAAAASSLAIDAEHPVARRIAIQAQGDLRVLERTLNERGTLRQQIAVDDVRRTISFFGSTAGEGGWRLAIVDAVDELNRSSANALLKVLEEPPQRALLLLISHSAGRVPATLRSRCRMLMLRPLAEAEVAAASAAASALAASDPRVVAAAAAAEGSVGRALALLDETASGLRRQALALLEQLPTLDTNGLHALGDSLAGTNPQSLAAFVDTVNAWLSQRLHRQQRAKVERGDLARLARVAEAWERINAAAGEVETYNLERKPFVFGVFGLLAEATRG
jgi:DNA polymerase III subunit delta'